MIETELKLTAPNQEVLLQVLEAPAIQNHVVEERSTGPVLYSGRYYDTASLDLLRAGCSFRARLEGEKYVAALKMPGTIRDGISSREEIEQLIDGWLQTGSELPQCHLKDKLGQLINLDRKLICRVQVDTQRTIRWLNLEGSEVELVCDHANIQANQKQVDLYEVELELKSGEIDPLLKLGENLQNHFDLSLSTTTKHQIGLSLLNA